MPKHVYEEVDHTADIALRVWGEAFTALLMHAAEGMYDLMGIELIADSQVENTFLIAEDSPESMLVDFLNECLYLAEVKKHAFKTFSFIEKDRKLHINATGVEINTIMRQIKAVTFHKIEIIHTPTGLETTITFDV